MNVAGPALVLAALLVLAGFAATVVMVAVIAVRLLRGLPVLPYEPRRKVPWGLIDLIFVVAVYIASAYAIQAAREVLIGPLPERLATENVPEKKADAEEIGRGKSKPVLHPLVVLIQKDPSVTTFILSLLTAVVAAPIAEEFFFRLLLQGWLEVMERRARRRFVALRRVVRGLLPVLVVSVLFAAPHFRKVGAVEDSETLRWIFIHTTATNLLTMAVAIGVIRLRTGATAADFGWVPERFWSDVRLGILAFLTIAGPIYLLQVVLGRVLPENIAPDPFTLVFFAAVLGTLYYRTHRIVPSVTLHFCLNATTLALAWTAAVH